MLCAVRIGSQGVQAQLLNYSSKSREKSHAQRFISITGFVFVEKDGYIGYMRYELKAFRLFV